MLNFVFLVFKKKKKKLTGSSDFVRTTPHKMERTKSPPYNFPPNHLLHSDVHHYMEEG